MCIMCASVSRVFFFFFYLLVGCGFAEQWNKVWTERREQAVSVNEGEYLGGLGRTVRLRDRLQGGERWVIVWKLCGCILAGM